MSADLPVWSTMPLSERLGWLLRFQRLIAEAQPRLCQLIQEETAKPAHEALIADVACLLGACKWLYRHGQSLLGDRVVSDAPFWLRGVRISERRAPLGKVGIIATWNYPVQLLGIQLIQALVAGNTVVVKPSERVPRTQTRLLELAIEAGLPTGTLTWVGAAREAGANMLATQKFDHVVFTGSTEVGQRIAQLLSKTMTPGTFELSGRDSAFVLEDANISHAAKSLWTSICMNAGQTCMAPRRALFVGSDRVYDKFVQKLAKYARNAGTLDMIDEYAAQRCKELASKALANGARDVSTLSTKAAQDARSGNGAEGTVADETLSRRFKPTVLVNCNPFGEVVDGKHFGPLLAVVRCASLEEALAIHRRCDQHLATSVFTRSAKAGSLLAQRLGSTNVMINDCILPTGHPGVSVGGRGLSGAGITRGSEGLLAMTRPVYVSTSRKGIAAFAKHTAKGMPEWQTELFASTLRWWYGAKQAGKGVPKTGAAGEKNNSTAPLPVVDEPGSPKPIIHQTPAIGSQEAKRVSDAA